MSHYETLGVPKEATPDDIKKAFRKKARHHHPDKSGGDHEAMSNLNHAYSVLMDPPRREQYDRTGSDKVHPAARDAAIQIIMQIFAQSLESGQHDPLVFARTSLNQAIDQIRIQIIAISSKVAKLTSKRGAMTPKDGEPNLFDNLVDQQIAQANQNLEQMERQSIQMKEALLVLQDYTSNIAPTPPVVQRTMYTTSTMGGFR